ncbi:unnamed protein product, partial [Owenia fusiformis]
SVVPELHKYISTCAKGKGPKAVMELTKKKQTLSAYQSRKTKIEKNKMESEASDQPSMIPKVVTPVTQSRIIPKLITPVNQSSNIPKLVTLVNQPNIIPKVVTPRSRRL